MSLVYVPNKKNGITYVYESTNYWDKEKKQSRSKRVCIGKLGDNGNLIPSKRLKATATSPEQLLSVEERRYHYGATYLFDKIGESLGITTDLKICFPEQYKQILSVAYFLIMEDQNSLIRFPKWVRTHHHPYGKEISSQRSSDLFASVTKANTVRFFRLHWKSRLENEYWLYDTISISSYSEVLNQIRYYDNKDNDTLPLTNLAMLIEEKSSLPFYFHKLAGNISDVKLVKKLLANLDFLELNTIKIVMDWRFYSEDNIDSLYEENLKFLIATKISLKYVQQELDKVRETIYSLTNYNDSYQIYSHTASISWNCSQERPNKDDIIKEKHHMYLHLYFSTEKAHGHENRFKTLLGMLQTELASGHHNPEHEKYYLEYFQTTSTQNRGVKVILRQEAIAQTRKDFGFFSLISNEIKDPIKALEIYRNKDLVEKAFGNLKDRVNLSRTGVTSERSLDGKLFVQFIALSYLSYINKQMTKQGLFKLYSMHELLDELDSIEAFKTQGNVLRIGKVTKKQMKLYRELGVVPPNML